MSDDFEKRLRNEISSEEYVRRIKARVQRRRREWEAVEVRRKRLPAQESGRKIDAPPGSADEQFDTGYPTGAPWWKLAAHFVWVAVCSPFRWLAERRTP